jgi:DNA/RNA-binding domain of Phe-tRNA-synthetase-like protein
VRVAVAPALAGVVRLGIVACGGASNARHDTRLDAPLADAEQAARRAPPEERQAVRTMYRRLGIDPTKTRPSSEALLRRVKKGDRLPRINTLVDICNWCSLELQLPYGLYDLSKIEPPIELRLGAEGEQYEGIRKDAVHISARPTLADRRGAFGNPTSDSARTMVTEATSEVLCVVFAPVDLAVTELQRVLDLTSRRFHAFAGASERWRDVI